MSKPKSRKPQVVEEPAVAYQAAPAAARQSPDGVRHVDEGSFRRAANKVFKSHPELFRKLAQ